jgi:hypothetical protein
MNVVRMNDWKDLKEMKRSEESYQRYLETLANSQLEIEVNALLEEFSGDSYGKDFFTKGQLILKEITSRAHGPVRDKIQEFTQDVLNHQ